MITSENECREATHLHELDCIGIDTLHGEICPNLTVRSSTSYPPGCSYIGGWGVNWNIDTTSTTTSGGNNQGDTNVVCSITCQPGTYQDESGKGYYHSTTTCKKCQTVENGSPEKFYENKDYQDESGKNSCKTCGAGKYGKSDDPQYRTGGASSCIAVPEKDTRCSPEEPCDFDDGEAEFVRTLVIHLIVISSALVCLCLSCCGAYYAIKKCRRNQKGDSSSPSTGGDGVLAFVAAKSLSIRDGVLASAAAKALSTPSPLGRSIEMTPLPVQQTEWHLYEIDKDNQIIQKIAPPAKNTAPPGAPLPPPGAPPPAPEDESEEDESEEDEYEEESEEESEEDEHMNIVIHVDPQTRRRYSYNSKTNETKWED
jgi:hypothetical protein